MGGGQAEFVVWREIPIAGKRERAGGLAVRAEVGQGLVVVVFPINQGFVVLDRCFCFSTRTPPSSEKLSQFACSTPKSCNGAHLLSINIGCWTVSGIAESALDFCPNIARPSCLSDGLWVGGATQCGRCVFCY